MGEKIDIRPFQGRHAVWSETRRDAPDAITFVPFRDFKLCIRMSLRP